MKKLSLLLLLTFGVTFANNTNPNSQNTVQIGDELIINQQYGDKFNHIYFPRLNFIVKRGGLANYNSVNGEIVVVKNLTTNANGKTQVTLKSKNGNKFFGFLNTVNANLDQAITSGELAIIK